MIQLKIEGMTCGHCVMSVKRALAEVPGATEVAVDLATGTAQVEGSPAVPALVAAVEEEGFTAVLAQ